VEPSAPQTINVTMGLTTPTVTFTATASGAPISASWALDKGTVGTIGPANGSQATFAPSGTAGGVVTVRAAVGAQTVTRPIMVELGGHQNGPNVTTDEAAQIPASIAELTLGGGVGGVGGEGLGVPASAAALSALASPTADGTAVDLTFLYPYDGTVWPRGAPCAPLDVGWAFGDEYRGCKRLPEGKRHLAPLHELT
jgi:hypothetical protein